MMSTVLLFNPKFPPPIASISYQRKRFSFSKFSRRSMRKEQRQLTRSFDFAKICQNILRAIFCKSHPICDSRIFRISSYFNQLKIKVILEYGRNFSSIRHFVEFLGGRETTVVFQEMQSVSTGYILKALSVLELFLRPQVTSA